MSQAWLEQPYQDRMAEQERWQDWADDPATQLMFNDLNDSGEIPMMAPDQPMTFEEWLADDGFSWPHYEDWLEDRPDGD